MQEKTVKKLKRKLNTVSLLLTEKEITICDLLRKLELVGSMKVCNILIYLYTLWLCEFDAIFNILFIYFVFYSDL